MGSVIPRYVAVLDVYVSFSTFLGFCFIAFFFFSPSFRVHFGCWKVVYNKDRMNVIVWLCRHCTVVAHEKTNKVKRKSQYLKRPKWFQCCSLYEGASFYTVFVENNKKAPGLIILVQWFLFFLFSSHFRSLPASSVVVFPNLTCCTCVLSSSLLVYLVLLLSAFGVPSSLFQL